MAKKAAGKKLRNCIAQIRRRKGLSVEEATKKFQAERFAEDMDFIKRAEAGENILLTDAQTIAMALGVGLEDLYPASSTDESKRKIKKQRHLVALK